MTISSLKVLSKITGPECGIHKGVNPFSPIREIFSGQLPVNMWISAVKMEFPTVPNEVLMVGPEDSLAVLADRIAEYLNKN